jgi:hypothetical protein
MDLPPGTRTPLALGATAYHVRRGRVVRRLKLTTQTPEVARSSGSAAPDPRLPVRNDRARLATFWARNGLVRKKLL